MASFRPYRRPANQVSVIASTRVHTQKVLDSNRGGTPKINYMERELKDGSIVKLPVVNENAARTLLANGFRRAYPAPGEETTVPTNPENTKHVICRPVPLWPFIEELNPFSLASFLQPSPEDIARYEFHKQMQAIRQPRQVTVEDYVKAIASGNLNPLLRLSQMSEEEEVQTVARPRRKHQRLSQKSILEKMMADAEQHASNFDAMYRASSVIHSTNPDSN